VLILDEYCSQLPGVPEALTAGQVQWAPDSRGVVFAAWDNRVDRAGILHYNTRPSKLFWLETRDPPPKDEKKGDEKEKATDDNKKDTKKKKKKDADDEKRTLLELASVDSSPMYIIPSRRREILKGSNVTTVGVLMML
jgi:hypothetical protein